MPSARHLIGTASLASSALSASAELLVYSNTSRYTDTSVISPHIIALLFYLCLSQKFKIGQLPSRNHKRQRSLSFGFRQDFAGNRFWDRRDRTDELFEDFYLRVSAVLATATCLGGWLDGWLSHSGIVSKRLNLSENFFDHLKALSF